MRSDFHKVHDVSDKIDVMMNKWESRTTEEGKGVMGPYDRRAVALKIVKALEKKES